MSTRRPVALRRQPKLQRVPARASQPAIEKHPGERRESGQILVLFALAIVVIMLFASIAIDLGLLRNNRQTLVNAVDSAALAGSRNDGRGVHR